ncbi:Dps family protein [Allostreptomyces psammosilenae]|uniref:Starvation-inducible DNA-binding protein n=1 Tax=Allostreptomyces psammosilenae TaxID=1892865 RepID=A0A852ZL19_9ACTN|nr:DNA starvation/stationary phase protection protein [Allostreptomyces psammosilenae]NYI03066.1 starvation-inducible DNA-binding protein [Allostreptomyces psammosilenae]
MSVVRSPLNDNDLRTTGDALQGALVDVLDLSLVAKQAHWNLVGPRFRSIHLQLDEVVELARAAADRLAERAAALGVNPDGRADTIAKTSGVPAFEAGWVKDTDVVNSFIEAFQRIITRMRERVDATEKSDPVTQDMIIEVTQELEKQSWMFQAENVGA